MLTLRGCMFLGIDIGTSSVKAVVICDQGEVVNTTSSPLQVSRPQSNWSEQNPHDWWNAVDDCVEQIPRKMRQDIKSISLSGQMHGATLIDKQNSVLRPAILWNDGRSSEQCFSLQNSEPEYLRVGANLLMPGFTAPKLEWVRQHEPSTFENIFKILLPKDYVRLRMCGVYATDMSDASGTLWLDIEHRNWHAPLLSACGLDIEHMPTLHEGSDITALLLGSVARKWGMAEVPVYAGGSDNAAGALGMGTINGGDAILSLGTSGVIFTATERFHAKPESAVHSFCHAIPRRWHLMSVMLSAASCLDWACRLTGTASVNELMVLAENEYVPQNSIVFLPYLSGERTPHNNVDATGVLLGLRHDTGAAQVANAVLEGVAFGLADGLDALLAIGVDIPSLQVIGGGARSAHWGQILASILNRPLLFCEDAEVGPALGAARLARLAQYKPASISQTTAPKNANKPSSSANMDNAVSSCFAEVFSRPTVDRVVEPDSALRDIYLTKQHKYRQAYQQLNAQFTGK